MPHFEQQPGGYLDLHTRNAIHWLCGWLTCSSLIWKRETPLTPSKVAGNGKGANIHPSPPLAMNYPQTSIILTTYKVPCRVLAQLQSRMTALIWCRALCTSCPFHSLNSLHNNPGKQVHDTVLHLLNGSPCGSEGVAFPYKLSLEYAGWSLALSLSVVTEDALGIWRLCHSTGFLGLCHQA